MKIKRKEMFIPVEALRVKVHGAEETVAADRDTIGSEFRYSGAQIADPTASFLHPR